MNMDSEAPSAPPPQAAAYPERQDSVPFGQQPADQPSLIGLPPPSYGDVADQRYSYVQKSEKNVEHMQQASPQYPAPQQQQPGYPMQPPQPAYPMQQPQPAYPVQQQPQPGYPVQQPAYQQQQQPYYANPPSYYPEQQPQQQQQAHVVVVQQPAVVRTTVQQQPYAGNYGQSALIFALVLTVCFVFFGCWPLLICSVLAIVFASNASSSAAAGNLSGAQSNARVSYGLSATGLVITVLGIVAFVIYIIAIFASAS